MDKFRERRQDKMIESEPHDPYLTRRHAGAAQCPGCGATCLEGRWSWQPPGTNGQAPEATACPACRRIADNKPAGTLTLSGDFVGSHHDEIMNLIRNTEEKEKSGHALERIMQCNKNAGRPCCYHHGNASGHAYWACTGCRLQGTYGIPVQ